jgi:hypothetical protein
VAPLMGAALRWLSDRTPATAELLRLMAATPIPLRPDSGHGPAF